MILAMMIPKRGEYVESEGVDVLGRGVGDVCIYVCLWLRKNYSGMDKTNLYDINGNNVLKKKKTNMPNLGGHRQVMWNH